MKTNFDKNIQDKFANHEFSYDANAWTSLSKELDKKMPTSRKSNTKWWLTSMLIIATTISGIYVFKTSNSTNQKVISKNTSELPKRIKQTNTNNHKNDNGKNVSQKSTEIINTSVKNNSAIEKTNDSKNPNAIVINSIDKKENSNINLISKEKINTSDSKNIQPQEKNTDIISPSNNENKNESNIKTDFDIENEIYYEKGLPSIKVKSSNTAVNYEWTSNNKVIQQKSKEVELHYFKKGTYSISLTTTNQSGQSSTETKNITINSDYNLLAVDAFSPTENNSKINTFIPFALTERNTQFTMVILDAKNGGIIYQTNDANQPWDGIDIRTGNMVPQGENCLWKVTIYNPEPGENSIYKGIILRM